MCGARVAGSQSRLAHTHQQRGVLSGHPDIRGHGPQARLADQAEGSRRQAVAQILVVVAVQQIAKRFHVNRLDLAGNIGVSRNLETAQDGDAKNDNERQDSSGDENNRQNHWCSRRSNSRFQTSRLCAGNGTTDLVTAFFWGTSM